MFNTCQWPASYHCNVSGKYRSGRSDSKCGWESMEAGGSLCTPQLERAGYSLRLVSRDLSSLWTLLHRSLNPLPLVPVTKLLLQPGQEAQAPRWCGLDPMSWAASLPQLSSLWKKKAAQQQNTFHKPHGLFLMQRKLPKQAAQGTHTKPSRSHCSHIFKIITRCQWQKYHSQQW